MMFGAKLATYAAKQLTKLIPACLLCLATSVTAQGVPRPESPRISDPAPQTITFGQVQGELTGLDARSDEGYYDAYRLQLRRGEAVQVDMNSGFDSYLEVIAPGFNQPLVEDDDGGRELNSRLRFAAPVAGEFVVRAHGREYRTGAYILQVTRRSVATAPPQPKLINSGSVQGNLDTSSAVGKAGERYELYEFQVPANTRVRISMTSTSVKLDPHLMLRQQDTSGRPFLITDDDGGEDENALIVTTLPEGGRYVIHAKGWPEQMGGYTLELQKRTIAHQALEPKRVELNSPIVAELAFGDPNVLVGRSGDAEFLYRLYSFEAEAGQPIIIELDSTSFDPAIDVGNLSPVGFAVAESNDDAEGTNARLRLTPERSGPLLIRARSVGDESGGEFTLRVRQAGADEG